MDDLRRHIEACNNAQLPGGRRLFFVDGQQVGFVDPAVLADLVRLGGESRADGVHVAGTRLQAVARALADAGHFGWRNEAFDVRAAADGPVVAQLDRGALPGLGVRAVGVHLNALVRRGDVMWLWVARRAADKLLDPGKLDHMVAGGVPAGLTPWQALEKEAEEEAGLPASLLREAREVAVIDYAMARNEGLRRDRLFCYDLVLDEGFAPEARDGEVAGFELWPLADVLARVRGSDDFKFNVNLVLIDLFRRMGMVR